MISWDTSYSKHCSIKVISLVEIKSGDYKVKLMGGGNTRVFHPFQKVGTSSQNSS